MSILKSLSMISAILLMTLGMFDVTAGGNVDLDESPLEKPLRGGKFVTLAWKAERGSTAKIDIFLTTDDGGTWENVGSSVKVDKRRWLWTVPENLNSSVCRLRFVVKDESNSELSRFETLNFLVDSKAPSARAVGPLVITKRQAQIEYSSDDGEGSGIASATLFYRAHGSAVWKSVEQDAGGQSPYIFSFPSRGKWDLYIQAKDHAGNMSAVPRSTTKAQITIDVQSGEPQVAFSKMKSRTFTGKGDSYSVTWIAEDDDLGPTPISLWWRDKNRNWNLLASDVANTGRYEWQLPNTDLEAQSFRIEVVDEKGNRSRAETISSLKHDVTAPRLTLTGPTEYIVKPGSREKPLRLKYHVKESGSGVSQMTLYYRMLGESQWTKKDLVGVKVYTQIDFGEPDGRYELILTARDKSRNQEEPPKPSDKAEITLLVDREAPRINITGLEKEADELVVSYSIQDANLGSRPGTLIWDGGKLDHLSPVGKSRIPLAGKKSLSFRVQAVDLSGQVGEIKRVWNSSEPDITPIKEPTLAFATKGEVVGKNEELTLTWSGSHLGDIKAELMRSGLVVETKNLQASQSQLSWVSGGEHSAKEFWKLTTKNKTFTSESWTVDAEAPKSSFSNLPRRLKEGSLEFAITVNDSLSGLSAAQLHFSQNGGQSWQTQLLRSGQNQISLNVQEGEIWLAVSAVDNVGNRKVFSQKAEHVIEIFKEAPVVQKKPQLAFSTRGAIVAPNKAVTLSWTSRDIESVRAELVRQGVVIETRQLSSRDSSLTWTTGTNHNRKEFWRFTSGTQSWKSDTWTIDAEAPKATYFDLPKEVVGTELAVALSLRDDLSQVSEGFLHYSQDQGASWKRLRLQEGTNRLSLGVIPGSLWLAVTAKDSLGNESSLKNQSPDKTVLVQAPKPALKPELAFTQKGVITAPGKNLQLTWNSKDIDELQAELIRSGKTVESRQLTAADQSLTWVSGSLHNSKEFWRFTSGTQSWRSDAWTVDAEAPKVTYFDLPNTVEGTELTVALSLRDDLSSVAEGLLHYSQDQGASWKKLSLQAGTNRLSLGIVPGELWLSVSAKDILGNEKQLNQTKPDRIVVVKAPIVELNPQLTFATEGGLIGKGEQRLEWTAQDLESLSATLVNAATGQVISKRDLDPRVSSLTWTPDGEHMSTFQWRFELNKEKQIISRIWQLDKMAPQVEVSAPVKVKAGSQSFEVMVEMSDQPAGIQEAILYYAKGQTVDSSFKDMEKIILDPKKNTQTVSIPVVGRYVALAVNATDTQGNATQKLNVKVVAVEQLAAFADFTNVLTEELILRGRDSFQLKWDAGHLSGPLTLEREEPNGQWTHLSEHDQSVRSHTVIVPDKDYTRIRWRLKHQGQVLTEFQPLIRVDASPPKASLTIAQKIEGTVIPVKLFFTDDGPAGWDIATLFCRKQGETSWTALQEFADTQSEVDVSVRRDPGVWEFYVAIKDRFGRGLPHPAEGTLPMATVTVLDTRQPVLAMRLLDAAQALVQGGKDVTVELIGDRIPEGSQVVIEDAAGKAVDLAGDISMLKDGTPVQVTFKAPRASISLWELKAKVGSIVSNKVNVTVDFENPIGKVVFSEPHDSMTPARVKVMVEDKGPAGVDRFELYRSDDEGSSWTLIADAKEQMVFPRPAHDAGVQLYLRVRDRAGFWSKTLPAPGVAPDLKVIWGQPIGKPGFDSFTDAGIYRGGRSYDIRWHGLSEAAELQYLPGPEMPWVRLGDIKPNQTRFTWNLPRANSRAVKLRLVGTGGRVLMITSSAFSIDSTPSSSRLSFLPSDVVKEKVEYTRPLVHQSPRHPDRPQKTPYDRSMQGPRVEDHQVMGGKPVIEPGIDTVQPYDFGTYKAAAEAAFAKKNYGQAARYLESAHRLNTQVAKTHDMLAQCYQKMHREERMIVNELHRAVELDPLLARAWNHLGVLARLRDDPVLAKRYFNKTLEIEPRPETHLNLGVMAQEDGRVMEARDHYVKVRQLLRGSMKTDAYKEATWRVGMLYTYSAIKDMEQARLYWAQILELFGRDSWQGKRARKWLREHDTNF